MLAADVVRRIHKERKFWRHQANGREAAWTLRGLEIAYKAVLDVAREEHSRRLARRPRVPERLAGDYFAVIERTFRLLKAGKRKDAIETLEKVVQQVRG